MYTPTMATNTVSLSVKLGRKMPRTGSIKPTQACSSTPLIDANKEVLRPIVYPLCEAYLPATLGLKEIQFVNV